MQYSELRRYQRDFAAFTALHHKDNCALPSHFDSESYTSAAGDNWDHEGEDVSDHDTATVLYQHPSDILLHKPNLSDTTIIHGPRVFYKSLSRQNLRECNKLSHRPDIPPSYIVRQGIRPENISAVNAHARDTT